jgi:hypothetical protein
LPHSFINLPDDWLLEDAFARGGLNSLLSLV